jgi:hypothetical protein
MALIGIGNETPLFDFEVLRVAPRDIVIQVPRILHGSLSCLVTPEISAPFTLAVGAGIVIGSYTDLDTNITYPSGQAIISLSLLQAASLAKSHGNTYLITEAPSGKPVPLLYGRLNGLLG